MITHRLDTGLIRLVDKMNSRTMARLFSLADLFAPTSLPQ